jgi:hypothetical protein
MAKKRKFEELQPGKPRQEHIDGYNFIESRRTWNPDPERMERELQRINQERARKAKKGKKTA